MNPWVAALLSLSLCGPSSGYKFLVTTLGVSGSQNLLLYRLADMLGERGHQVTMLKGDVLPEAKSAKLRFAKEIVYPLVGAEEDRAQIRQVMSAMPWETSDASPFPVAAMWAILGAIPAGCDNLLANNSALVKQLQDEHFDAAFCHLMDFCVLGLMPHLGVKAYVQVSTAMMMDFMAYYSGTPAPSSWVPSVGVAASPPLSIPERLKSFAVSSVMTSAFRLLVHPHYTRLFRRHLGDDYPDMEDVHFNTSLYYINADPFFEYPRPTLHNVVYMGGVTMEKPEALTGEWAARMESAKDGVVLFSLGSVVNTRTMPLSWKLAFLRAFQRFPSYTFVWRLEGELPEASDVPNVVLSSWLPQRDLMGHPNLRAFITHGGYNSLTEATYHGVPLLMFPLFGDQYANVKRVERLGVGVRLEKEALSEEAVHEALSSLLGDVALQERARRLGRMIRAKPVSSYDQAMRWAEFLGEFGALETLLPDSRNLSFVSYYLLDAFAIVGAVIFAAFWLLKKLCGLCCCRGTKAARKSKRE